MKLKAKFKAFLGVGHKHNAKSANSIPEPSCSSLGNSSMAETSLSSSHMSRSSTSSGTSGGQRFGESMVVKQQAAPPISEKRQQHPASSTTEQRQQQAAESTDEERHSVASLPQQAERCSEASSRRARSSTSGRRSSVYSEGDPVCSPQEGHDKSESSWMTCGPRASEKGGRSSACSESFDWQAVMQQKEQLMRERGQLGEAQLSTLHDRRHSGQSTRSWTSRSSADVPVAVVLASGLYTDQADVRSISPSSRRNSCQQDPLKQIRPPASSQPSRGFNSADFVREIKQNKRMNRHSADVAFPKPRQGYVDELTPEEEAIAIVTPATRQVIASDGLKYTNGRWGVADAHTGNRHLAAQAQLARAAFNLPSVRDAEVARCRYELRITDARPSS